MFHDFFWLPALAEAIVNADKFNRGGMKTRETFGNRGPHAARDLMFLHRHNTATLFCKFDNRSFIERLYGRKIEHRNRDSLAFKLPRRHQCFVEQSAGADDADSTHHPAFEIGRASWWGKREDL